MHACKQSKLDCTALHCTVITVHACCAVLDFKAKIIIYILTGNFFKSKHYYQ